jgi:hypothetical protein
MSMINLDMILSDQGAVTVRPSKTLFNYGNEQLMQCHAMRDAPLVRYQPGTV